VGHRLAVLPQEAVQTFPFPLLKFNTCSSRSSLTTSYLMLSISFWRRALPDPILYFLTFFSPV
jgi:hypothetical protein